MVIRGFNNVEIVTAQRIGSETTTYVRNIYKYYVAYKLQLETRETACKAREQVTPGTSRYLSTWQPASPLPVAIRPIVCYGLSRIRSCAGLRITSSPEQIRHYRFNSEADPLRLPVGSARIERKEQSMDPKELLKNFHLFRDVSTNDLLALESIAERKVFLAGDLVYSEGEEADALFLIEMGTVDIVPRGKEIVFATIGSGQGFGELAFFERGTRSASASLPERTHLLRISFERLSKLLAERPGLALLVYRNACAFFAKHFRMIALDLNRRYL